MATKTAKPAATKKAAPKSAKKDTAKADKAPATKPQGPLARVVALYGSKDKLVDRLAPGLAGDGEDEGALKDRLRKASNHQLLRLHTVVEAVTKTYGGRAKLVEAVVKALGKAKDQAYVTKLGSFSLPRLYDLAKAGARRAKTATKSAAKSAAKPAAKPAAKKA